jgi:nucleotide-binding universal stress UspA family protein
MTEVLTGSLATRLMHNSSCDIWFGSHKSNSVLEARNGARFCILCATGLTEEGVPLLRYTDQIAQILDAEVSIVHSISDNRVFSSEYGDPNFLAHARVNAAAELDRMQAQAGTAYPMRISFGGISKAVRDAAREEHPNLIVIGRGKSQRHFGPLWTHAYSIIREAECPVLSYGCDAGAEFASGQADEASSERHGVAACV